MDNRDKLYIDGVWVPSTGRHHRRRSTPPPRRSWPPIPAGTPRTSTGPSRAAKAAFEAWAADLQGGAGQVPAGHRRGAGGPQRGDRRRSSPTRSGMPIKLSPDHPGRPADRSLRRRRPSCSTSFPFEETVGNSLVVREPVGVVGAITPWNYPLHQIAAKVAPALAAGCTVVLKPSRGRAAQRLHPGRDHRRGRPARRACSTWSPASARSWARPSPPIPTSTWCRFTGSTRAGKRVTELAAETVKRVALELGGKSANVILDDADFAAAVRRRRGQGCFLNSGQTCSALTRMLVPRARQDEVEEIATATAESYTPGDPFARRHPARPAGLRRSSANGCAATSRRASTRAPRW